MSDASHFLSVTLATQVWGDRYLTDVYKDFTTEVDAFFRHVSNDMETFMRHAPTLFRLDVGNSYAWLFVFANGDFQREFFGAPRSHCTHSSFPICDVAMILRDHPKHASTVVHSIEAANARDQLNADAAVAAAKEHAASEEQERLAHVERRRQLALNARTEGGLWNWSRFFH